MSVCPKCEEMEKRMQAMKEQARKALDLVREAGDRRLLRQPDSGMECLSRVSVILQKIGRGDA